MGAQTKFHFFAPKFSLKSQNGREIFSAQILYFWQKILWTDYSWDAGPGLVSIAKAALLWRTSWKTLTTSFFVGLCAMKIMYYTHCCLTETSTVMNCGTVATNSLLLPVTTNETLFIDNYTKTPTNTPSPFRLCITHIVQLRLVNSQ